MHVKPKTMAFGGLLLALSVVCMALGSVIETNTLFLLAAASYFVGIVIREFGMRVGAAFYVADVLLGFMTAPNKFYVMEAYGQGSQDAENGNLLGNKVYCIQYYVCPDDFLFSGSTLWREKPVWYVSCRDCSGRSDWTLYL